VKEFNDSGPEQAAYRLGDLFEVAHRIRKLGIRNVEVSDDLRIRFYDHRFRADVRLDIEPWFNGPGWFWYADLDTSKWTSMGPLAQGRWILRSPQPRQVVRAYQQEVKWGRGRLPLKRCS
jgi:hypothetical protein